MPGVPKDPGSFDVTPGFGSMPWVVWLPSQRRCLRVVPVLSGWGVQAGPLCWEAISEHPGSLGPILGTVTG